MDEGSNVQSGVSSMSMSLEMTMTLLCLSPLSASQPRVPPMVTLWGIQPDSYAGRVRLGERLWYKSRSPGCRGAASLEGSGVARDLLAGLEDASEQQDAMVSFVQYA